MTQALELSGSAEPDPVQVPPQFARLMWAEIQDVINEVVVEIRRAIPEYDRPENSAYDQILRLGAEKILTAYIERIADPAAPLTERDETCRALGHFEAVEGRSLDHMQAAYRIAFHIAWRRTAAVAERERIPSVIVTTMVESMLTYMDEAITQTRHGYQQAMEHADLRRREHRRQLLHLILQQPAVVPEAIEDLARTASWPLPDEVTMVAIHPDAPCTLSALDADVLIDLDSHEPCLLVPGPLDRNRRGMLEAALSEASSVLGLTMPLDKATHSLRWSRRVLELAEEGIIRDGSLIPCERHLMTMWLLSDVTLVEELASRHLAPFDDMSDGHRRKLTETLAEWVTTRGNAVELAERMNVHAQTVRYRLRQLESYLGESLADPDTRFSLDVTLRAASLHRRRHLGRRGTPGTRSE
ncbi:helix-turn-helix domain-containing protein [Actinomadura fulvescens]|uniref:Helix-turn-helix domain-containing protein n=1 Tax=Actinomadura fulvescens TaxID=46160 RepID=A0ABP6C7F2_9ACTN